MRKTIIRSASILGMLLLLVTALIVLLRFYPYPSNFPAYPKITHTRSGAAGDPINLVFVGTKDQIMHSFQQAGWLLPDPITPQKTAGTFGSGRQEPSSVDNSSGWDRHLMIAGLSSVRPTIFPPITLLPPSIWKEMPSVLTWKKPVWSEKNPTGHLLLPFCMHAMGAEIIMRVMVMCW